MRRALFFILGALLMVFGLLFAAAGGALASLVGPSGSVSTDVGKVKGDGYALVFNEFAINTAINADAIDGMGDFTVGAKSTTPNQIFMGIGPEKEVNAYLSGSARDVVSDIDGGSSRVVPIPGPKVPASPDAQTFWLAKAQGSTPELPIAKSGPNTTMVIMNVVPAKPVGANLSLGMTSGSLFPAGIGLLIFGVLLIVLGVFALIKGAKGKKAPPLPPPGATPAASPLGAYAATPAAGPDAPGYAAPPPPATVAAPPTSPPPPSPPTAQG